VRIGIRGREVKVTVAYSSLTFALKAKHESGTGSSLLVQESMIAAYFTENTN
jgi:hypothetical protein